MSTVLVPSNVLRNFSRLWVRKQLTYFRLFDSSRAGVVSDHDVYSACVGHAQNATSDGVPRTIWQNVFAPAARMSEAAVQVPWEDFILSRSKAASEQHQKQHMKDILEIIETMFNVADLNRDGILQRHEHMRLMALLGLSPAQAMVSFTDIDVNDDDIISATEFRNAMLAFFFQSTETRFTKILGQLDRSEIVSKIDVFDQLQRKTDNSHSVKYTNAQP